MNSRLSFPRSFHLFISLMYSFKSVRSIHPANDSGRKPIT